MTDPSQTGEQDVQPSPIERHLQGKTLLVLGGKPIGSYEIVAYAKSRGARTIVTDYIPTINSRTKQLADEIWDVSTTELDTLVDLVRRHRVDGVYAGAHEVSLFMALEICEQTGLPFYITRRQWEAGTDKRLFKEICQQYNLPVIPDFTDRVASKLEDGALEDGAREDGARTPGNGPDIPLPVIVKPVDRSGGRGITVCYTHEELKTACEVARTESATGRIIVEKYMEGDEIAAYYTIKDGHIRMSAFADYHYNYDQIYTARFNGISYSDMMVDYALTGSMHPPNHRRSRK